MIYNDTNKVRKANVEKYGTASEVAEENRSTIWYMESKIPRGETLIYRCAGAFFSCIWGWGGSSGAHIPSHTNVTQTLTQRKDYC